MLQQQGYGGIFHRYRVSRSVEICDAKNASIYVLV
jgi:hypothetical protein